MCCVLPGLPEVLASLLLSVSILIKEDLPTFERPIKANSGLSGLGQAATSTLLTKYFADFISIVFCTVLLQALIIASL